MGFFDRMGGKKGRKKEEERAAEERDSMKQCLEESIQKAFPRMEELLLQKVDGRLETYQASVDAMNKRLRQQAEAVEDLMDEWKEREAETAECEKRLQEKREREEALVRLVCDYKKQLDMLEERVCGEAAPVREASAAEASRQDAWQKQFRLLREQLAVKEKLCALEAVGTEGEYVDYRIHEVLRALDAEKPEQAGTVAGVHSRGIVYEGKVMEKAEVDAYKIKPERG